MTSSDFLKNCILNAGLRCVLVANEDEIKVTNDDARAAKMRRGNFLRNSAVPGGSPPAKTKWRMGLRHGHLLFVHTRYLQSSVHHLFVKKALDIEDDGV